MTAWEIEKIEGVVQVTIKELALAVQYQSTAQIWRVRQDEEAMG